MIRFFIPQILEHESRQAIRERAELATQVAAMSQQLKATTSSTQGINADRNAMAADLETLRQNRSRLEQVKYGGGEEGGVRGGESNFDVVVSIIILSHEKLTKLDNHVARSIIHVYVYKSS